MTRLAGYTNRFAELGTVNRPTSGSNEVTISYEPNTGVFSLTFTLNAARITVTDGAGSGSHGSLKLFDFAQNAVSFLGSRQDYTAFVESSGVSGGDTVFEIGVGTTAISAAADGTLGNGAQENVGQAVSVTLSGGAGTGTAVTGSTSVLDGTGTALDLYLNWSGTAATVDASGSVDVTGTITISGVVLGDD